MPAQAAAFSPDGQKIVYADGNDLKLAKSDGSESRKVVTLPDLVFEPAWSPDGSEIRFRIGGGFSGRGSLWEVTRDGTNLHPLFPGWHNPPTECCGIWTVDGKYSCFSQEATSGSARKKETG